MMQSAEPRAPLTSHEPNVLPARVVEVRVEECTPSFELNQLNKILEFDRDRAPVAILRTMSGVCLLRPRPEDSYLRVAVPLFHLHAPVPAMEAAGYVLRELLHIVEAKRRLVVSDLAFDQLCSDDVEITPITLICSNIFGLRGSAAPDVNLSAHIVFGVFAALGHDESGHLLAETYRNLDRWEGQRCPVGELTATLRPMDFTGSRDEDVAEITINMAR